MARRGAFRSEKGPLAPTGRGAMAEVGERGARGGAGGARGGGGRAAGGLRRMSMPQIAVEIPGGPPVGSPRVPLPSAGGVPRGGSFRSPAGGAGGRGGTGGRGEGGSGGAAAANAAVAKKIRRHSMSLAGSAENLEKIRERIEERKLEAAQKRGPDSRRDSLVSLRSAGGSPDPTPSVSSGPAASAVAAAVQKQTAALQTAMTQLEEERASVQEQARALNVQLHLATRRLHAEEEGRKVAESRLAEARQHEETLLETEEKLREYAGGLEDRLGAAKEAAKVEKAKLNAAEGEVKTLRAELEHAAGLEEKLRLATSTTLGWQQKCRALEDQVRGLAQDREAHEAEQRRHERDLEVLKGHSSQFQSSLEAALEERARAQAGEAARGVEIEALKREIRDLERRLAADSLEILREENARLREHNVALVGRLEKDQERLALVEERGEAGSRELHGVRSENAELRRVARELEGRCLVAEEHAAGKGQELSALSDQLTQVAAGWQEDRLARLEASQDAVSLQAQVEVLRKANSKLLQSVKKESQRREAAEGASRHSVARLNTYSGLVDSLTSPAVGSSLLQHTVTPCRSLIAPGSSTTASLTMPSALLRASPIRSLHFSRASTPPGTPPRVVTAGEGSPAPPVP